MKNQPISPEKLAANRANAARSTGPQTAEGKRRSAQNARKHGLTAAHFTVVHLEEAEEVTGLTADVLAVYQPVNSQETYAVERIALAQHVLLRAARLESGLFTRSIVQSVKSMGKPHIPHDAQLIARGQVTLDQVRAYVLADGFHELAAQSHTWTVFLRYQAQAERHYRRAIEDFERLVALRPSLPPPLPQELPNEPTVDPQPDETTPFVPPGTSAESAPLRQQHGSNSSMQPGKGPGSDGRAPSGSARVGPRSLCSRSPIERQ